MARKRTANKEAKPEITEKPKAIDWDKVESRVTLIGLGGKHLEKDREYPNIAKHTAKLLVEKGVAKLK